MRRRASLVTLTVLAAIAVLSACGAVSPYAAKVNGERISRSELEQELKAIQDNAGYLEQVEQSFAQQGERVKGQGRDTLDTVFVARVLNVQIGYQLVHQEVARRKLKPTPEDLAAAREAAVQSSGGPELFEAFPEDYRDELVRRRADVAVLQRTLVGARPDAAAVKGFYEQNPGLFAQTCVRHILVDSREKAVELKSRIAAGEDFAAVARAESKDNQGEGGGSAGKGGALGCISQEESSQLVPEFAAALTSLPPGQVSDPVQTQFGFHLVQVTERRTASLDEATPQIQDRLEEQSSGALATFVQQAMARAEVVVNPRYGRFVRSGGDAGVRAPQELSTTTTPQQSTPSPDQ